MTAHVWVVIPAYNEATVVKKVVAEVREHFDYVVVVNDLSSDYTADVAQQAGAYVINHPINLGQGASLQTGFEFALQDPDLEAVVTFDADGQHEVKDAVAMVKLLYEKQLDVVLGSRFLENNTHVGAGKSLILKAAAKWSAWVTGMNLTDAHNGLRVISKQTLERITIKQNRMAHASEIVDQLGALPVKYEEYPTHIRYTEYSKAKGQPLLNSVNIFIDLLLK